MHTHKKINRTHSHMILVKKHTHVKKQHRTHTHVVFTPVYATHTPPPPPPNCPPHLLDIMRTCLSIDQETRPNFSIICETLETLRVSMRETPVRALEEFFGF
eukprot:GDKI01042485.1.p2 GENE.GDKI01042485.1~~GDKI01042485.1.p2  ORF type:complete len:102 (+),score=48.10 GDKI01042485.1:111-416(+)